ncbi:MAG: repeat protein, partial [Verrucomicrobia bacterium]|nr:repeat protein [Verrucomicrobiota bacterium]
VGAFALPSTTSKDAALVTSLAGGVYSAKLKGSNNTTGTVLADIYDANPSTFSASSHRLVNISARATMTNDNPLIAGFVVGGSTAKTLLIRAIGPYLTQFFGASAMADPKLDLYMRVGGNSSVVYSNDNWGGTALLTSTGNSVGAFPLTDAASKDAVLLVTLDPGIYSANVLGVNNSSGITLVEVYEIP